MPVDRSPLRSIQRGLLLSLALSLAVIVWLNLRFITPATGALLRQADPLYLGLAAAVIVVTWLAEALRLALLLRLSGPVPPFRRLVRIVLATFFAAGVTPLAAGQGPVQVYLLHREGVAIGRATAVLSLRLFLTTLTFTLGVADLATVFPRLISPRLAAPLRWAIPGALAVVAAFAALLLNAHAATQALQRLLTRQRSGSRRSALLDRTLHHLQRELEEFASTLGHLRRRDLLLLAAALLLTALYWLLDFSVAPLLLLALHRTFDPVKVILLQALLAFLVSVVPLPGGSGVSELGFAGLFRGVVPAAGLGLFVSLWRLLTYHLSVLAGAVSLAVSLRRKAYSGSSDGGSSSV
ncbi:MAG: lysylphosphatidylglycerol synthase transmembrane domain-containing protein [Chitinophagales bacterium]